MNKKEKLILKQVKRNNTYSASSNNNSTIDFGSGNNKFSNGRKWYYSTSTKIKV